MKILLPALALLVAGPVGGVRGQAAPLGQLRDVGIDEKPGAIVPLDIVFRDESGNPVHLERFAHERPIILAFVYHECPMLCSLVLDGIVRGLRPLSLEPGRDFDVVVVSIDPRDKAALAAAKKEERLKAYGRPSTASGWHFLTGEEPSIRQLAGAVGFRYRYVPENGQYAHASGIIVLTPDGRTSRYFQGVEYAPRDLRLALVEASAGKIGSPSDQVLLLCLAWDPSEGKYSLAILGVLRVAGIATVLALATFVISMARRDRRNRSPCERRV